MKRRAILSVRGNPACKSEEMAMKVVEDVWDSCFHDTRPFDEVRLVSAALNRTLTTRFIEI